MSVPILSANFYASDLDRNYAKNRRLSLCARPCFMYGGSVFAGGNLYRSSVAPGSKKGVAFAMGTHSVVLNDGFWRTCSALT
jgi:hypothetical protein